MAKTIKTVRKDNRTVRFTITSQMGDYDQTEYATLTAARKSAYTPKLVAPETYAVVEWRRKPGGTRWLRAAVHAIREDLDRKFRNAWKGIADGRGRVFLDLYAAPKKDAAPKTTARKASSPTLLARQSPEKAKRFPIADATNEQLMRVSKVLGFDDNARHAKFVYGHNDSGTYTPALRHAAITLLKSYGITQIETQGPGWCAPVLPKRR